MTERPTTRFAGKRRAVISRGLGRPCRRTGRGYTGLRPWEAMQAGTWPAGRRSNWPGKWRLSRAARWRGVNVAKSGLKVAVPGLPGTPRASRSALSIGAAAPVLLNLWATWCVALPQGKCRALDALQAKLAALASRWSRSISTPAISTNRRPGSRKSASASLPITPTRRRRTFQDLKQVGRAFGMPTTLLVDPNGCEIGTIAGPAEWGQRRTRSS